MPWLLYTMALEPPPTGQWDGDLVAYSSAVSSSSNREVLLRTGRGGCRQEIPVIASNCRVQW
jgi:hypothetical protein